MAFIKENENGGLRKNRRSWIGNIKLGHNDFFVLTAVAKITFKAKKKIDRFSFPAGHHCPLPPFTGSVKDWHFPTDFAPSLLILPYK